MRETKGTDDFRELILHYLSSQVNSHAAMIVGFSVVLFTYMQVMVQPTIQMARWQHEIALLILMFITWILIFVAFRLSFFGLLIFKLMGYSKSQITFSEMWNDLLKTVDKSKLFLVIPAQWFRSGLGVTAYGGLLSLFAAFLLSIIVAVTSFWKTIEDFQWVYGFMAIGVVLIGIYLILVAIFFWKEKKKQSLASQRSEESQGEQKQNLKIT